MLLTQLGGTRLRHELDRVPLWRGNHVSVKQLAEDFATYLYLPRLRDETVLLEAIRDGPRRLTWQTESFAYADAWDEKTRKYIGLQTGRDVQVLLEERSVLVKPDVAAAQMQADQAGAVGATQASGGPDDRAKQGSPEGCTTKSCSCGAGFQPGAKAPRADGGLPHKKVLLAFGQPRGKLPAPPSEWRQPTHTKVRSMCYESPSPHPSPPLGERGDEVRVRGIHTV